MSRFQILLRALPAAVLGAALSMPAHAQDDGDDEDVEEGTITSGPTRKLGSGTKKTGGTKIKPLEAGNSDATMEEVQNRPYPSKVYVGAESLGMDPEFLGKAWKGTELVYKRDYRGAKRFWDGLQKDYPGLGVGHVGSVLIYQSMMMENFDFKYEKQYNFHLDGAIDELEAGLDSPGNEGWEHFMIGAMLGVDSIHVMRKGDYLPAITQGMDAIKHIDKVKEIAPNFRDPLLGDGLYKYWRSVISQGSRALPDFEDLREEGIADMKTAEAQAVFLGPGASLSLAFVYIEEREMKRALEYCSKNHRAYPDNVINNLVYARTHLYMRRYDDSLKVLDQIVSKAPDNERVYYYLATVHLRKGDTATALKHIDKYLSFGLDDYYRAQALHRKGDVYWRKKDYDAAENLYRQAVKEDGYKPSKAKLDRIKKMRKSGKI